MSKTGQIFDRFTDERDRLTDHIAEVVATRDSLDGPIVANREHRRALAGAGQAESQR